MNIIKVKNNEIKLIDENILKGWYDEYNKQYFNDMLDKASDIQIVNKNTNYEGLCTYSKKQILMNAHNLDDKYMLYIKNTFLHEMIHMMQGNLGYNKGHGKSFLDKANEINQDGWNIKVHIDEDELRFVSKIEAGEELKDCLPLMNNVNTKYTRNLVKEIFEYNDIEYNEDEINKCIVDNQKENNMLKKISTMIDNDNNIPKGDWEQFLQWKNDEAIWNLNKEGDKTGLNKCIANIIGFIENFPKTKGKIKFNNIRNQVEWNGKQLVDRDIHFVLDLINKYFINDFSNVRMVKDALDNVAFKNRFNPWVNYFNNLKYEDDGVDYIDYTIKEVLRCEEQDRYYDLYYETLKIFYLATMHRIYQKEKHIPVKFDMVTTICSRLGGSGKGTFFEKLCDIDNNGNTYCYVVDSDSFNPASKDFLEASHQCVCLLLDELKMNRAVITAVKGYVTKRADKFRKAYGYVNEDHIRGFTIVAASNNDDILKDYTTDMERRWAIIKINDNTNNYKYVNKAFDDGFRDKLWAFIKHIYDTEEFLLYMTDDRLIELEEEIQRGYKASNNVDYNSIVDDLLEREYGFVEIDGDIMINTDFIVKQYQYGNSKEWCKKHNHEIILKEQKFDEGKYIMQPEDIMITKFGKINRISKKQLYDILHKLGFEWTKPSLNAEMRCSKKWNGAIRGKNICRINGTIQNAYWREEECEIIDFNEVMDIKNASNEEGETKEIEQNLKLENEDLPF